MLKYCCIDLETTGLNDEVCQIIQFAAVIREGKPMENVETSPSFNCYVHHDLYQGEPYALGMNAAIFNDIGSKNPSLYVYSPDELVQRFKLFMIENGYKPSSNTERIHFVIAGKNVGSFDLQFLKKLPKWKENFNVSSGVLDPGMQWIEEKDKRVPGLAKCLERGGTVKKISHDALEDVFDTIEALEKGFNKQWSQDANTKTSKPAK